MPAEMLFCGSCEKFANWVQVDGFRCPCKGVRRPGVGERGRDGGSGGVLGRWRRRRVGEGEGMRSEEGVGRRRGVDDVQTVQAVQIGVM
jgi:hypothetical protein